MFSSFFPTAGACVRCSYTYCNEYFEGAHLSTYNSRGAAVWSVVTVAAALEHARSSLQFEKRNVYVRGERAVLDIGGSIRQFWA